MEPEEVKTFSATEFENFFAVTASEVHQEFENEEEDDGEMDKGSEAIQVSHVDIIPSKKEIQDIPSPSQTETHFKEEAATTNPLSSSLSMAENESVPAPSTLSQDDEGKDPEILVTKEDSQNIPSHSEPQKGVLLAPGSSLSMLVDYGSDDDDPSSEEKPKAVKRSAEVFNKIQSDSESESSDDESSASSILTISSESDDEQESEDEEATQTKMEKKNDRNAAKTKKVVKTRGELDAEDLPPIQDLQITVPQEECVPLGTVFSIVDKMVVVESLPNTPALDLDSVLFSDKGEALGSIFDVFGPVTRPYYVIRFNSTEHITNKGIEKGRMLFCAPQTRHTSYVFTHDLLKEKGSDASWKHNNEPPPEHLDYSDDEEEKRARQMIRQRTSKKPTDNPDCPSKRRPETSGWHHSLRGRGRPAPSRSAPMPPDQVQYHPQMQYFPPQQSYQTPPPPVPPPYYEAPPPPHDPWSQPHVFGHPPVFQQQPRHRFPRR